MGCHQLPTTKQNEPNRVCITPGGNLVDYLEELKTRTTYLITTNINWNSVISTTESWYICVDIKHVYLATPMEQPKYMYIPIQIIPSEFMKLYNLKGK